MTDRQELIGKFGVCHAAAAAVAAAAAAAGRGRPAAAAITVTAAALKASHKSMRDCVL
jgi:hypothetical protein